MIDVATVQSYLARAIAARLPLLDDRHETAVRLFNGFLEGCPQLVVELFGETAVLTNHATPPEELNDLLTAVQQILLDTFPWLQAILLKTRAGSDEEKQGVLVWDSDITSKIRLQLGDEVYDLLNKYDAEVDWDSLKVLEDESLKVALVKYA